VVPRNAGRPGPKEELLHYFLSQFVPRFRRGHKIIADAPSYIDPRSIQGTRGQPNRVPVDRQAHRDAHYGGANGGQPRYNVEFQNRLNNIRRVRPLTAQDYWDIRARMLWEYFGI